MRKSLTKEERTMLGLDLKNPDAVVAYIMNFYREKDITSEEELINELAKHKPLIRAIELQKKKSK